MKITIGHLYPDLLNLYGDRGNIITLLYRLRQRGIEAEVREYYLNDDINFSALDIVLLGGGSDREQMLVCKRLRDICGAFSDYIDNDGVTIAICGGYQLLGEYYRIGNETIEGLHILDIYTENEPGRIIGNVVVDSSLCDMTVVGFENHGGRTYIGKHKPLGCVISGNGNNGKDGYEGVVYKNVIGTYLHGPLLPKNPQLCDWLLRSALKNKGYEQELAILDDTIETKVNSNISHLLHKR